MYHEVRAPRPVPRYLGPKRQHRRQGLRRDGHASECRCWVTVLVASQTVCINGLGPRAHSRKQKLGATTRSALSSSQDWRTRPPARGHASTSPGSPNLAPCPQHRGHPVFVAAKMLASLPCPTASKRVLRPLVKQLRATKGSYREPLQATVPPPAPAPHRVQTRLLLEGFCICT